MSLPVVKVLWKTGALVLAWLLKIVCQDTPILMVSKRSDFQSENCDTKSQFSERAVQGFAQLRQRLKGDSLAYAMAALPILSVPIQDVQLLDYAVAHKTVNSSYGLTASTDDTYIIDKDPYTSDQQRQRDQYTIDDDHINEVVFKEVLGSTTAKLALHDDWIKGHGYAVDAIININLPEQGISGPFNITSIKHIIPQKKPVDEDESDEWEYRPVTGLFVHESNDVWKIKFDDGTELGVGHIEIGEEVLAKSGNVKVVSKERDLTLQPVFNLEVKDLHNFLVGDVGVVVHNACNLFDHIFKGKIEIVGGVPSAYKIKITGIHSNKALDGIKARIKDGTKTTPNANGYYKAKVEMHHPENPNNGGWKVKDEESTFFPDEWNQDKVAEEIAHGLSNKQKKQSLVRTRSDGSSYSIDRYKGYTTDGTKLQIYIEKGKEIPDTVFPDIN